METSLSIVITTYNRKELLRRCLNSIMIQDYSNYEVIVVDDHSIPSYKNEIVKEFPQVKYLCQAKNSGPGPARNRGIETASSNFVIIMDDDDIFRPEAFEKVNYFFMEYDGDKYPVYNFILSNSTLRYDDFFRVYSFEEMIDNAIIGDVIHVINKEHFLSKKNYSFPASKIGAESLLWYQIALDYGFPIINEDIVQLMDDSEDRLTNTSRQVKYANEFANYQLDIITNFKYSIIEHGQIRFLIKKYMGAVTYLLLSGKRRQAISSWREMLKYSKKYLVILPLFLLPRKLIIQLFYKYRLR
ncbi:glycosyltransferase family 2 protein [Psychrobacillus sp. PGGUH221]|uniref:glycosyltransferase family 2 protein n=1 Tax=Psychrobacillus sp. PGGUH221 TaxID=3020058 RepID=UPI0035C70BE6